MNNLSLILNQFGLLIRIISLWCLVFIIISPNLIFAQKTKKEKQFGFHLAGRNKTQTSVNFDVYANLIVLKLKIDSHRDTLNFILDTGVSSLIITDSTVAEKFKFKYVRNVKIKGAGKEESVNAKVTVGHTIHLGFVKAENQNLVVLEEDILKLSEYMGVPIHGLFGYDLFQRFVVNIDFGNKRITFIEPSKYKERKNDGTKFPLIVTATKPYIEAGSFSQLNQEFQTLRLVIDTGAGHALMLNTQDQNPQIILPEKVIRANLGKGINGDIDGHIGRIARFKVGDYEFNNILASFPDSISFSQKFDKTDVKTRQGSIGGELLRRFNITFNYSEAYMKLKPLKTVYRETFEHDMSGMEVRAMGELYDEYFITFISKGSQAEKAGIEVGDQIIFMNNKHYNDLNINDIYRYLSKKEGSEIELFLRNKQDKALKFAYFKLKRVI